MAKKKSLKKRKGVGTFVYSDNNSMQHNNFLSKISVRESSCMADYIWDENGCLKELQFDTLNHKD